MPACPSSGSGSCSRGGSAQLLQRLTVGPVELGTAQQAEVLQPRPGIGPHPAVSEADLLALEPGPELLQVFRTRDVDVRQGLEVEDEMVHRTRSGGLHRRADGIAEPGAVGEEE